MSTTMEKADETFVRNIETKTGKTWADLLAETRTDSQAPTKHGELTKYLQGKLGLTYGYANFVALKTRESLAPAKAADADPVDEHYAGAKAALRPIYEKIASAVREFGPDVEFAPKKTYMSLRRKKQFGCVHPTTSTRVDVGLNMKNVAPAGRLEASNDGMFSHRVRVTTAAEVDGEVLALLRQAYEQAG